MAAFDLSTLRTIATGLRFPEGPVALHDGSVAVVEIEGGSVAHVAQDGSIRRFDLGGGPNGAAFGPDGALYVCNDGGLAFRTEDGICFPWNVAEDNQGGLVQKLSLEGGGLETVFTHSGEQRLGNLNDIVFDAAGGCYIVDTSRGLIHHADPERGSIQIAAGGLTVPNGGGLSPDGTTLYVSETYSGRLIAFDVVGAGQLTNQREHYSSNGTQGFDGLAVDGAGNICVANLGDSGISVISPEGALLGAFKTPKHDPYVTNICFGGANGNTAYICSAGRGILYSVEWPWPGLRLNFAR